MSRVEEEAATEQYLREVAAALRDSLIGYPEKELHRDPRQLLREVAEHLDEPELAEGM